MNQTERYLILLNRVKSQLKDTKDLFELLELERKLTLKEESAK